MSTIHFFSMSHSNNQDRNFGILNITQDTIITNTVTPQA